MGDGVARHFLKWRSGMEQHGGSGTGGATRRERRRGLVRQVARRREGPGTDIGAPPMEAGDGREKWDMWAVTGPVAGAGPVNNAIFY
jgi:hypothetical protein